MSKPLADTLVVKRAPNFFSLKVRKVLIRFDCFDRPYNSNKGIPGFSLLNDSYKKTNLLAA